MLTHYVRVVVITKKMATFFQDRVLSSIQPTPLILSSCVVAQAATQATQAKGAMLNGLGGVTPLSLAALVALVEASLRLHSHARASEGAVIHF